MTNKENSIRVNKWRRENLEGRAAYMRDWRKKNPEKAKENSRKGNLVYRANHPEQYRENARAYARRMSTGMTREQAEELMEIQSGICAICRFRAATHADHDHSNGMVRGILCHQCNAVLGFSKDNISVLQAAIDYLKSFEE